MAVLSILTEAQHLTRARLGTDAHRLLVTKRTHLVARYLLAISATMSRKTRSGAFSMIMVSRVFAFPLTAIRGGLKVSDTWSLRMLMALKRHLKQKMALISRDEASVWIILSLEILREEVVAEAVDLAIEVAVVEVVDSTEVVEVVVVDSTEVVEVVVVDAVDLAIVVVVVVVEVVIVVVVVVVPLEACLKMVALPPFKVKKSLSKPPAPFRLSVTFAMRPDR